MCDNYTQNSGSRNNAQQSCSFRADFDVAKCSYLLLKIKYAALFFLFESDSLHSLQQYVCFVLFFFLINKFKEKKLCVDLLQNILQQIINKLINVIIIY